MTARYGHYVKHGGINATVPRDLKPEELTLDQAVSLLAERAAKGAVARSPRPRGPRRQRRPQANDAGETPPGRPRPPRRRRPRPSARPPRRKAKAARRAPEPMAKGRVPTRDELLAFIKESATPVGKREIARAFGLKGDQRIELKELLRDLRDSGDIAADRAKTFKDPRSTD